MKPTKKSNNESSRVWKPPSDILESYALSVSDLAEKIYSYQLCSGELPRTYEEAVSSKDSALWQAAVDSEILSQLSNQTLDPCVLPTGRKAIPLAWVFKSKQTLTVPQGTRLAL